MNMNENANLIECLRSIGFTDTQITDLFLAIEGRISIEEFASRYKKTDK